MKQQYKASYLEKNVFDSLSELKKKNDFKLKIIGLLESVSTFDTISNLNLTAPDSVQPLLAVTNNLISRGNPTICSRYISSKLNSFFASLTEIDFYYALHLIDARQNLTELYDADLGSRFESAFLNSHIPANNKYLTQFFQHQRKKGTLTNDGGDEGRVDFSFETPYFKEVKKTTVYQKEKELKERSVLIIEVDGKQYHNTLIDDIRDYETARFGHTTKRITESNIRTDTRNLLETINQSEYFQAIEKLRQRNFAEVKKIQTAVLTPIAIARLQKVINQYLISHYKELIEVGKTKIKIAVIERDVPCGHLATNDLNSLYLNLVGLENRHAFIPEIEATVFADNDFFSAELQPSNCNFNNQNIEAIDYDLIIDVSTLWRTGVFSADNQYASVPNLIIIRSAHFTEHDCIDNILCADGIQYRDLTLEDGNERHKEIDEAIPFIEYFLQNIFQKEKFRKGQLPILNRALKNETVIGLLPTGGGKSLTYQLAALLQPGITIIIDPIRSLMVDQFEGLLDIGIDKCDFINSILSREEKEFVQEKVLPFGKTQFIFCSPERLVIQEFRDALRKTNGKGNYFSYCVIDEAHCVSEWGHDFRTPYLNLGENAQRHCLTTKTKIEFENGFETILHPVPLFGLTATASFDVLADIERELKINRNDGKAVIRYENSVRDEINYLIYSVNVNQKSLIPEGRFPTKVEVGEEKLRYTNSIIKNLNNSERNVLKFNSANDYREVLKKTFNDYLPSSEIESYFAPYNLLHISKEEKREKAINDFVNEQLKGILLTKSDLPFQKNNNYKYNYGVIVFCPHKTSELGVETYIDKLVSPNDKIVFFKGSGNSLDKDEQDKQSFENLKLYKENEASVMVATKAFGMGIDKPNVRLTVHSNISSSIESFVQESGRAGRDGKTSLSIILYNNQIGRDREVLERFYRNSFKGADKERSVIWELRNKILFPNITNLKLLNEKLNEEFDSIFLLNHWTGNNGSYLYVNDENRDSILSIRLRDKRCFSNISNHELTNSIYGFIEDNIPDFLNQSEDQLESYFKALTISADYQKGIEYLLNDDYIAFQDYIIIPFQNTYYSKGDKGGYEIVDEFAFAEHYKYFKKNSLVQWLINNNRINESTFKYKFKEAVKWDNSFEEFVNSLPLANVQDKAQLLDTVTLRVRYYIPRNQDDTAKAIYRLTSIGIIDTYTIEYQQKIYKVKLSKKPNEKYFKNYEELVGRYTSPTEAIKLRVECQADYQENKENSTVISKCLEHLTNFIYEKIANKRKRAIDDMVSLCEETIVINDPIKQSKIIKENIYYYFNAKYAREGNVAQTINGLVNADLNKDFVDNLSIEKTIWKYIEQVIDYDDNGQIINNIKHLRGATMRMLRGTSGAPQFNILKAYSLYFLSSITPNAEELIKEAIQELKLGIIEWSILEPENFYFENFFFRFKENISKHIGKLPDDFFGDVDDDYYTTKNLNWLKKFNNKFLIDYKNAVTTSN